MSQADSESALHAHSSHPPETGCPGLDPETQWDDAASLRGHIYLAQRLNEHAAEIARAHGQPSARVTAKPLQRTFVAARARIRRAYTILGHEVRNRRDPSPAEEWLLDNSHVVEDQVREIQEDLPWGYLVKLPRLAEGVMRGHPRVYGLAIDYLRHTDGRVDLGTLSQYVLSYQSVHTLTIGELWAVPIMLRLGLILRVGALAASEANGRDRSRGDEWADRILGCWQNPEAVAAYLIGLERRYRRLNPTSLVQLLRRLREHDTPLGSTTAEWIRLQCEAMGTTPDDLARREHLRQAADQVSVGNAITSMRAIAAFDWNEFFERTSSVEAVLRKDPALAYADSDDATRDRCRHAVEDIARRSKVDEGGVAHAALSLAEYAHENLSDESVRSHIGYYLIDEGRSALEAQVKYRSPPLQSLVRGVARHPTAFYFSTLFALIAAGWAALALVWSSLGMPGWALGVLLALALWPASEVALTLVNVIAVSLMPPRLLAKKAFVQGIPDAHRTLVAVPALIDSVGTIKTLIEDIEVRSLANPDVNLYFALLTDFTDAESETRDGDDALLAEVKRGIDALNARYDGDGPHRFWLLHRKRLWNPTQQAWMGWERKRGKLEEMNRLLRGDRATTFDVVSAPSELVESIRYVITLDADTELPRDVGRRLVATLAHPLNRPVLDPETQRVVRGYGVVQPRVGTLPLSSRRSRFARIAAGPPGIDPYTTAVSDVYQDVFAEGSYVGKAIYDVDAFSAATHGRAPENQLLSHDLFEGLFARCALASDIEVLDEQPSSYAVVASRQHRWLRGDWQLLPWVVPFLRRRDGNAPPPRLRLLDWWKLFDNLRRSLLPPALLAFLLISWFFAPATVPSVSVVLAAVFFVPLLSHLALNVFREANGGRSHSFVGALGGALVTNLLQIALNAAFLLDQALVSLDAIARTAYRMWISRRQLLEWTTMGQAARSFGKRGVHVQARMWFGAASSVATAIALGLLRAEALPFALPLLLAWALAPILAAWLSLPLPPRDPLKSLTEDDRDLLRQVARKTWRFFDTFVGDLDHHLPPDNYQEDPRGVVAHRTSPTNIGLYLLSVVAARDFGFLPLSLALDRIGRTLATIDRLDKREGHILNWYETTTLRPLDPQYVSTVDSGNLAAYLWTLAEACAELARTPIVGGEVARASQDALRIAIAGLSRSDAGSIDERVRVLRSVDARLSALALEDASLDLQSYAEALLGCADALRKLEEGELLQLTAISRTPADDVGYWIGQARLTLERAVEEIRGLLPFGEWLALAPPCFHGTALAPRFLALRTVLVAARTPRDVIPATRRALELAEDLEAAMAGETDLSDVDRASAQSYVRELALRLRRSQDTAIELVALLDAIAMRARAVADGMNFRFLYDEQRELFSIGYNVGNGRLDPSHYDLLASEARLASLLAIAKGDAPQKHWFRLARPRTAVSSRRVLLSWSGSMFEYLMPLLVMRSHADTLLDETYETAVLRQVQYGRERKVPWGVSESAYNVMDLGLTYQYRAFGVPGLGLKAGLGEDLVVAPYATVLSTLVRPDLAVANLRTLTAEGFAGTYGFYEAIDYTPAHVPPGRRYVAVKAFMAHHQGMSLVALDNVLNDGPMVRRFHADPRIKASELLLEERVPARSPLVGVYASAMPTPVLNEPELDVVEHFSLRTEGIPPVHLLGHHGEISTLISATGTGSTTWRGLDVNRFREDPVLDAGGIYVYVRNLSSRHGWSSAYQPTRVEPDAYDAAFAIDRVEFHRRDAEVETITEIVVSPEDPAEVRRITLTNHGATSCEVDVTTYTETVLASRAADVAHRAFGSLFIETEALSERGALLARRRPRSHAEAEVWLVQVLAPQEHVWSELDYESSRSLFVGRGGTLERPAAQTHGAALTKTCGPVLDPALVLRRKVKLGPGERARIALTTAVASSREEALALVEKYAAPHSIPRTFELGWADARVELKHLGITAVQVHRFQRLLSALWFPQPALRASTTEPKAGGRGLLWAIGVSADLPIVLLRVDEAEFSELCRELLLAHEFWRLNGVSVDLVILNEEPSGYLQPLHEAIFDLIRSSPAEEHTDQRGRVFVRRVDHMSDDSRDLLIQASRVVLRASAGSLSRQLRMVSDATLPAAVRPRARSVLRPAPIPARPTLVFDNGIGGFSEDGREYVMWLDAGTRPPAPWCNVMANPHFGSVISEGGAGYTWFGNSQRHRLTPWSNDAVCDPAGEALYVRDEDDGSVWSPTPHPAGAGGHYVVSHGQGYTRFEHTRAGLAHELTVFVSATDPVKVYRLRVRNDSGTTRRLSIFGVVEWVLGGHRETSRATVVTEWDAEVGAIFAQNTLSSYPTRCSVFAAGERVSSATGDREEFFGRAGSREKPAALRRVALSGSVGGGLDPCAALQVPLEFRATETAEICFVLADGDDRAMARGLAERYAQPELAEAALHAVREQWDAILGTITVRTPDPALDVMVNRWLLYQALSCRIWARSGFFQSSGAFGFRDQLQDVLATLHARPQIAREHLLRAAARQFKEGDVQHWWHPETGEGVRTHYSDDLLWLPFAVAEYVRSTGDSSVLDERIPFLDERTLAADEHDLFGAPASTPEAFSLYEHCVRALDAGLTEGKHGLPLMRGGDWNDGMNRVGEKGVGESVWLAWFLGKTLRDFSAIAAARGDVDRKNYCVQVADRLGASVDAHAWDGAWYRRAYFDDGTPLGSHESAECRIDAIAQSWAVISGLGDPDRATRALSESERLLVRESERLMLLLWPPFEKEGADPGYIRAYPPGIRENGGQYTHGVLWTAQALALAGEGDRAAHLFALLNPIRHADGTEAVARYKVEPYVVAADVYGADPHLGRGGWTWYTGSASWMYRIAVEDMLGVRREGARLIVDPSIPRSWAAFEIDYRVGSTLYAIRVENPFGVSTGVRRVEIDGRVSSDHGIPLVDDGRRREIRVSLGRDQGLGGGASPPERPPASAMSMHGASK